MLKANYKNNFRELLIFFLILFIVGLNESLFAKTAPTFLVEELVNFPSKNKKIRAILISRDGTIWVGTANGLFKQTKDGNHKIYQHLATDASSLSHNSVQRLYEDHVGNIWIGTKNGLCRYRAGTDNFKNIQRSSIFLQGEDFQFYDIFHTPTNQLFLLTSNGIFIGYPADNFLDEYKFESMRLNNAQKSLFSTSTTFRCLRILSDKTLLVGTDKGLYHLRQTEKGVFSLLKYIQRTEQGDLVVTSILVDDYGLIWLGTEQGLIFLKINTSRKGYTYHFNQLPQVASPSLSNLAAAIGRILPLNNQKIGIVTKGGHLHIYHQVNGQLSSLQPSTPSHFLDIVAQDDHTFYAANANGRLEKLMLQQAVFPLERLSNWLLGLVIVAIFLLHLARNIKKNSAVYHSKEQVSEEVTTLDGPTDIMNNGIPESELALNGYSIRSLEMVQSTKNSLLIVDDNFQIRQLIREIFEPTLFVVQAENGKEGCKLAIEKQPDIIILDIMMPEIDGFELCAQLKQLELTKNIPLILLSALNDFDSKKKGFEKGGDIYISKPFDPQLLKLQILNLLKTCARGSRLK